jgi:hypothetical protein
MIVAMAVEGDTVRIQNGGEHVCRRVGERGNVRRAGAGIL